MQTQLSDKYRDTAIGQQADAVLRSCVHCGFCNATCPTYQLLGDELDGPRGRIYQIKQVLEGQPATATLRNHLDRCLTCRACETTCPSGVQYHRLLDIGRELVEIQVPRSWLQRKLRSLLGYVLRSPQRVAALLFAGRLVRPLMPARLRKRIPVPGRSVALTPAGHSRRMLLLDGCVQPAAAPQINAAAIQVFDRLGIHLSRASEAGCCGALQFHLSDIDGARQRARENIDAWWPFIEQGTEAIVITATGCAPMVKDYAHLLKDDPQYTDRAERVSALARDISEVLRDENLDAFRKPQARRISFHAPCTLQHGQQLTGVVEKLLQDLGYELTPVPDAHLCCGSAGTYSILQPDISGRLLKNKLQALQEHRPALIATANIGCLLHLQADAGVPVIHWIELLKD